MYGKVIAPPPVDVVQCELYQQMLRESTREDGLAERVTCFIKATAPLLDSIHSGPFKEYTLHNRDHAKKLVHLAGYIIAPETIRALSALECAVLIMACYLHDMGMVVTAQQREELLSSDQFVDSLRSSHQLWASFQRARQRLASCEDESQRLLIETEIFQLQEAGLCEYLRPRHATVDRYAALMELISRSCQRDDLYSLNHVSFAAHLIEICVSHNLDCGVLAERKDAFEDRFPQDLVIGGQFLNTQFIAAVLRLADILDFDRERTPAILFDSLGISTSSVPGSQISLREWQKHMAVHTLVLASHEIVVTAECRHPVIESSVRTFCRLIEQELRGTVAVLRRNPPPIAERYRLIAPTVVRARIQSIGYTFKELSFRLNQPAIMNLLMGERLYSHPGSALRELVQNSIDACAVRSLLERSVDYVPSIIIESATDTDGRLWIEVCDNGIGMDEHVLSEYFFQAGSSYYDSPEFGRIAAGSSFTPVARFGIGVLSVFMVADILEVTTTNRYSPRRDTTTRCLRIETGGTLAFVTESNGGTQGTRIRVRLRPEYTQESLGQFSDYLRAVVVRPRYPVAVTLADRKWTAMPDSYLEIKPDIAAALERAGFVVLRLDLKDNAFGISGRVYMILTRDERGRLSHLYDGAPLRFGHMGVRRDEVFPGFSGDRVTVNGFRMAFGKLTRTLAFGRKPQLLIAYDLELHGSSQLEYDVARTKLVGKGRTELLASCRQLVVAELSKAAELEQLDPATKDLLDGRVRTSEVAKAKRVPKEKPNIAHLYILDQVEALLPGQPWPNNVHRLIAQQLGVDPAVVHRAITKLVMRGRVEPSEQYRRLLAPTQNSRK